MKIKLSLILLTVFTLLLVQFTYAQTDFRTSVDIEELNSYVDYSFKLESSINEFNLEIPKSSQIIYLRDDYGDINYKLENDTISMDLFDSDKDRLILIKLKTKTLISKKDNYYELIFESKNDGKVTINLPDNVILNSIETNPKTEIKTYDEFSYVDFDTKQEDILIIKYKTFSSASYWIYLVMILFVLIVAYFMIRKRKSKVKQKVKNKSDNEINIENSHSNMNQNINPNLDNADIEINSKINKEKILKTLNIL